MMSSSHWPGHVAGETIRAGEILSYLDVTPHVHFLIAGKVRVMVHAVNGKAIVFSDLTQGELYGELAAIDGLPRSAPLRR